jgi:Putative prokaryotic signal transducing protein
MGLMAVKGWQVVFRGDRIQADLLAAVLQADGVRVEVFGDNAYGVGINLTDARVMVPDEQAEAARELIRAADATPIDPEV